MNEPQKPLLLTVIHICLIIIGFGLVGNFAVSIYQLWKRGDIVLEKEQKLLELEAEQVRLKNSLSYALTQDFIEEEARNKLNMIKPGETLVVLPQNITTNAGELAVTQSMVIQPQEPILTKWWRLFLGT